MREPSLRPGRRLFFAWTFFLLALSLALPARASEERRQCYNALVSYLRNPASRDKAEEFLRLRARLALNRLAWGVIQQAPSRRPGRQVDADFIEEEIRHALSEYNSATRRERTIAELHTIWEHEPYQGTQQFSHVHSMLRHQSGMLDTPERRSLTAKRNERTTLARDLLRNGIRVLQLDGEIRGLERTVQQQEERIAPYRLTNADLKLFELLGQTVQRAVLLPESVYSRPNDPGAKERILAHLRRENEALNADIRRLQSEMRIPDECVVETRCSTCQRGIQENPLTGIDELMRAVLQNQHNEDVAEFYVTPYIDFLHRLDLPPLQRNLDDVQNPVQALEAYIRRQRTSAQAAPLAALRAAQERDPSAGDTGPFLQAWARAVRQANPEWRYFRHGDSLYDVRTGAEAASLREGDDRARELVLETYAQSAGNGLNFTYGTRNCWMAYAEARFNQQRAFTCRDVTNRQVLYELRNQAGVPVVGWLGGDGMPVEIDLYDTLRDELAERRISYQRPGLTLSAPPAADYQRALALLNDRTHYVTPEGLSVDPRSNRTIDTLTGGATALPSPTARRTPAATTVREDIDAAEFVRRYIATRDQGERTALNTTLRRAIEWDRANNGRYVEAWAQAIREEKEYFTLHARVDGLDTVILRQVSTGQDVDPVALARARFPDALGANINFVGFSESCQRAYVGARLNGHSDYSCYEPHLGVPTLFLYRVNQIPRVPTAFVRGDLAAELRRRDQPYTQPSGELNPAEIFRLEAVRNNQPFYVDASGTHYESFTGRAVNGPFRREVLAPVVGERAEIAAVRAHIASLSGEQQALASRSLREILAQEPSQQSFALNAWVAAIETNRALRPPRRPLEFFNVVSHSDEGDVQVRHAVTGAPVDPQALIREREWGASLINMDLAFMPANCRRAFASAMLNRQDYYVCYDRLLLQPLRNQSVFTLYRLGDALPDKIDGPGEARELLVAELTERMALAPLAPGLASALALEIQTLQRSQGALDPNQQLRLVALANNQTQYTDTQGNLRSALTNARDVAQEERASVAVSTITNPTAVIEAHIAELSGGARDTARASLYAVSRRSPADQGDYLASWARSLRDERAYFPVRSRGVNGEEQLRYYHSRTGVRVSDPAEFVRAHLFNLNLNPTEMRAALRALDTAATPNFALHWASAVRQGESHFLTRGADGANIQLFDALTGRRVSDYGRVSRDFSGFAELSPSCQAAYAHARLSEQASYACRPSDSPSLQLFRLQGTRPERVSDVHGAIDRELTRLNVAHERPRGPVSDLAVLRAVALSNNDYFYDNGAASFEAANNLGLALGRTPLDYDARYYDPRVDRDQFSRELTDWRSDRSERSTLNRLDDEQTIVEWHQRYGATRGSVCESGNYSIIDKENSRIRVYNNDGRLIWERPVLIGTRPGDQRTRWERFDPGQGGRGRTNQQTGAGVFGILEIRDQSRYHQETYAGQLFSLFDGDSGEEIAVMAAHRTPLGAVNRERRLAMLANGEDADPRMSNGCINLAEADFADYRRYVGSGCRFYVLPENTDVRTHLGMSVRDGDIRLDVNFRAPADVLTRVLAANPEALSSDPAERERLRLALMALAERDPATGNPWVRPADFQPHLRAFILQQAPGIDATPRRNTEAIRRWRPLWDELAATAWPTDRDYETSPPAAPRAIEIQVNIPGADVIAAGYRVQREVNLRSPASCMENERIANLPHMRDYVLNPAPDWVLCPEGQSAFDLSAFTRDYMDELPDRPTVIREFVGTLTNQKEEMMAAFNLSNDDYNDLALLAIGILGQESEFGQSWRYVLKRMIDDRGGDAATRMWREAQEDRGTLAGVAGRSVVDGLLRATGVGGYFQEASGLDREIARYSEHSGSDVSNGLTQIKRIPDLYFQLRMRPQLDEIRAQNPTCPERDRAGQRISDCAIHTLREQTDGRLLRDPRESAYATMAYLTEALRSLRSRARLNAAADQGSVLDGENLPNFMAYYYNGGICQVSGSCDDQATPESNQYTQRLREFLDNVTLTQFGQGEVIPQRRVCRNGVCTNEPIRAPASP